MNLFICIWYVTYNLHYSIAFIMELMSNDMEKHSVIYNEYKSSL